MITGETEAYLKIATRKSASSDRRPRRRCNQPIRLYSAVENELFSEKIYVRNQDFFVQKFSPYFPIKWEPSRVDPRWQNPPPFWAYDF